MDLKEDIEFWEHEYLEQIFYLLKIDEEKMLDGFRTKENIRSDWEDFLGEETSDFATGSERIFYWLFNQFGIPNSSPIGSDLFFETYNAYVHIDIKTVQKSNVDDYKDNIFVGDNQNSFEGEYEVRHSSENIESRSYSGKLPQFYTKKINDSSIEKKCLTYFIAILYDETNLKIQSIFLTCMPNGALSDEYPDILQAGKNPGKIRFRYSNCKYFKLLEDKPLRTKILIWDIDDDLKGNLGAIEDIYTEQFNK